MRFMLLITDDGAELRAPAEIDAQPEFNAWLTEVEAHGARRVGTLLRPASEAVTVRVREGRTLTSDGPFAETKEWVGGVEIVECADLATAVTIAERHPATGRFPIEVRQLEED